MLQESSSKKNQTQEERRKMINEVYDIFDTDKSGYIQASELESILKALGRGSSPKEIEEFLSKVDTDQSGTIERHEFMDAMDELYSIPQTKVEEVVEAFKIFDKDNSGTISLDEMKKILLKYTTDFTESEIEEIFKLIDTDQNGFISYAEFADVWKFQ